MKLIKMENYIVRIYRYNPKRPDKLIGTIKGTEYILPIAFSNIDELWKAIQLECKLSGNLKDREEGEKEKKLMIFFRGIYGQ